MTKTILLHGALGTAQQMAPFADLLDSDSMCIDFPGHGALSADTEAYSIESMAEFVLEQIDEPVELFGHSMGGYVALYLAAHHPELVTNLTTLATKFDWTPEGAAKEVKMLNPEIVKEKVPAFAKMLEVRHGKYWPSVMIRTADMMLNLGASPLLTSSVLGKVQCPVLLMRGSEDKMVSEQETLRAKSYLQDANYKELEGQPHPFERTDLNLVRGILQQSRQS